MQSDDATAKHCRSKSREGVKPPLEMTMVIEVARELGGFQSTVYAGGMLVVQEWISW